MRSPTIVETRRKIVMTTPGAFLLFSFAALRMGLSHKRQWMANGVA